MKKGALILRDRPLRGQDNYLPKLLALRRRVIPGRVYRVDIRHDSWCSIWRGGRCNCDPDVEIEEVAPRVD